MTKNGVNEYKRIKPKFHQCTQIMAKLVLRTIIASVLVKQLVLNKTRAIANWGSNCEKTVILGYFIGEIGITSILNSNCQN